MLVTRIGFAVSGAGRLARAAIGARGRLGLDIGRVILDAGADPDLDAWLAAAGVRSTRLEGRSREGARDEIHAVIAEEDDTQWMLTFDRLIRCETVLLRPGRITNYHPALLPANPGRHAVQRGLASGARFTGATIHEVDCDVDAGRIIAQAVVPIGPGDSEQDVADSIFALGLPMFLQVCVWYSEGRVETSSSTGGLIVRGADYASSPISPRIEPLVAEVCGPT